MTITNYQTLYGDVLQQLHEKMKQENRTVQDNAIMEGLRTLLTALKYEEKRGDGKSTDVLTVLQREIKKYSDGIDAAQQVNRIDIVEKYSFAREALQQFMPQQLTNEEVTEKIHKVLSRGISDFGNIMKIVKGETQGKVDGKRLAYIVKQVLNVEGKEQ